MSRCADKEGVKEKLKALWEAHAQRGAAWRARFMALWRDPENALLFRGVLTLGFSALVLLLSTSGVMIVRVVSHVSSQSRVPASVEEEEPVASEPTEGTSVVAIGARAIPRSISKRQDGIQESDKDLVQSEIQEGRGLASIRFNQETETAPYNPYFTYNEILGSTSERGAHVGRVAMDVAFEVDTSAAMRELQEREKEIKFMISSLVAEIPYEELRADEGRLHLKKRIFKEVNYVLKKGKVKDVLYSSFVMK